MRKTSLNNNVAGEPEFCIEPNQGPSTIQCLHFPFLMEETYLEQKQAILLTLSLYSEGKRKWAGWHNILLKK